MKSQKLLTIVVTIMIGGFLQVSNATVPKGFKFLQTDLSFLATSPPALVYVENSQGLRTGADPSLPMTSFGSQGDGFSTGLNEIPLSQVIQLNEENDANPGVPQSNTGWDVNVYDGGKQTYTVNIKGIVTGVEEVKVYAIFRSHAPKLTTTFDVLISPGQVRQVTVTFDPGQNNLLAQPVVGSDDLLNDIKTACQLNQITSHHVCKRLEEKAEAIQDALKHHRNKEAEELVKSFLHSLGEDRGDGDNDKDDRDAIKEPALSILVADTKALLQTLPDNDHHDH